MLATGAATFWCWGMLIPSLWMLATYLAYLWMATYQPRHHTSSFTALTSAGDAGSHVSGAYSRVSSSDSSGCAMCGADMGTWPLAPAGCGAMSHLLPAVPRKGSRHAPQHYQLNTA